MAPAGANAACTAALEGHVVDRETHEPIAGATVRVAGQAVAMTNEDGRFIARELCAGRAAVAAERLDYRTSQQVLTIGTTASVELALEALAGEVIEIQDDRAPLVDMRAATTLTGAALERTRGRGLAEALAEVPGVTQLRSASGMAKPIIRGQYGWRLLMLVDGVRHASQDWGLDHAPEIDPFVADRLTVVRGAAGVQYGPDAIGGAVIVDPPPLLRQPGYAGEAHLVGVTNGRGGSFAGRLRGASESVPGLAFQLEGSIKRLASPSTPDYPLDNTAVDEWNAGATIGYRRGGSEYRVSFLHYDARLGVCRCLRIESIDDFLAQLDRERPLGSEAYRSDFEIERGYQAVTHETALARAQWQIRNAGQLTATYAFQYDRRREYDLVRSSVTGPQFHFRLATHDVTASYDHRTIHVTDHLHLRGSAGLVGRAQQHNYSGLTLIPDFSSWGGGVFALERLLGHDFELEAGVRYDGLARTASLERIDFLRLVRSDQLAMDACNGGEGDAVDCATRFHTLSLSVGALRQLTSAWSVKLEVSTAARPPNPDEQYLNGASPTFPVLGLGKPDLRPETTYSGSVTTTYRGSRLTAEASAFANYIADYIYFAPAMTAAGEPVFDVTIRGAFPRFTTRPVDATFYGADGGVAIAPSRWLELGAQLSLVRARNRTDDSFLVFVPADRARGNVTYKAPPGWGLRDSFANLTGEYVARQRRFDPDADLAPPPEAYFLLGAELGTQARVGQSTLKVALQGSNLLNRRYRDYTSLLRYFADQPGLQLLLRLSIEFSSARMKH